MTTKLANPELHLRKFIGKFEPKHQRLIRSVRRVLRRKFPTLHELVYDNYNFFVIGYCSTERPSDCIFSLAAASSGVGLCFTHRGQFTGSEANLGRFGQANAFSANRIGCRFGSGGSEGIIQCSDSERKAHCSDHRSWQLIIRSVSTKQRHRGEQKPRKILEPRRTPRRDILAHCRRCSLDTRFHQSHHHGCVPPAFFGVAPVRSAFSRP